MGDAARKFKGVSGSDITASRVCDRVLGILPLLVVSFVARPTFPVDWASGYFLASVWETITFWLCSGHVLRGWGGESGIVKWYPTRTPESCCYPKERISTG